uniref:Uncharacterized protein n=1 Tax=Meloidogyne floridensis TaxID=298350 RepID=A0A915PGS2_9BILA
MMFKGFSKTNEKPEEIKNQEINENNELENNEKLKKSVLKNKEKANNDKVASTSDVIDKKGKKPIKYEEHDFKQITKNKTKKIAKNEKIKVDNKLKLEESSKSNEQSENEKPKRPCPENKDEVKETVDADKNKFGREVTIKIGRKDYKCRNISIDQINIQIKNKNVDENCSYGNSKGNICKNNFEESSSKIQRVVSTNTPNPVGSSIPQKFIQDFHKHDYGKIHFMQWNIPTTASTSSFYAPPNLPNPYYTTSSHSHLINPQQHLNPHAREYNPQHLQSNTQPDFKQYDPFNHPFGFDKILDRTNTNNNPQFNDQNFPPFHQGCDIII